MIKSKKNRKRNSVKGMSKKNKIVLEKKEENEENEEISDERKKELKKWAKQRKKEWGKRKKEKVLFNAWVENFYKKIIDKGFSPINVTAKLLYFFSLSKNVDEYLGYKELVAYYSELTPVQKALVVNTLFSLKWMNKE